MVPAGSNGRQAHREERVVPHARLQPVLFASSRVVARRTFSLAIGDTDMPSPTASADKEAAEEKPRSKLRPRLPNLASLQARWSRGASFPSSRARPCLGPGRLRRCL